MKLRVEKKLHRTAAGRAAKRLGALMGLRGGDALIVVDVQRDFLAGGALPVPQAENIIEPINSYIAAFEAHQLPIILTRDWHPEHHRSFRSEGGPWPRHCVQGTPGAQWGERLAVIEGARIVSKGTKRDEEGYSAFAGTTLLPLLRSLEVRRLFISGLTTEYCVHDTVLDARTHGFDVALLSDTVRAVNAAPGDEDRAIASMLSHGAIMLTRPPASSRA